MFGSVGGIDPIFIGSFSWFGFLNFCILRPVVFFCFGKVRPVVISLWFFLRVFLFYSWGFSCFILGVFLVLFLLRKGDFGVRLWRTLRAARGITMSGSSSSASLRKCGAPDRVRTCNIQFRRLTLYPVELRALDCVGILWNVCNLYKHKFYLYKKTTPFLMSFFYVFLDYFLSAIFDHSTNNGLAVKIDEYVPIIIPAATAKMK